MLPSTMKKDLIKKKCLVCVEMRSRCVGYITAHINRKCMLESVDGAPHARVALTKTRWDGEAVRMSSSASRV